MIKENLGRLAKEDLRKVWGNEAGDFTPWLAQEENLALLGEVLELDLELESQEKNVGLFRADILCKDLNTQQWVLIENQIERTDHTHLGQLLTYAAGLKAVTIVWISAQFTDEHRAVLDWLNEVTEEGINFFGLEIELWRIGDSPLAPRFNVVSKPNLWTHTVSQAARAIEARELSETRQLQLEFWTELKKKLEARKSAVRPHKPLPQHWMNFALGRSNIYMKGFINSREKRCGVIIVTSGPDSKAFFHLLENDKTVIETQVGENLDWRELPNKNESRIRLQRLDFDLANKACWDEYVTWMVERLEKLRSVFGPLVKNLNASDYIPDQKNSLVGLE